MHDLTVSGNLLEAGLWAGIALTLLAWASRESGRLRRLWAVLGVAFLVFAVSDVIESQTGAWWRPLWLLALKAVYIAVFLYGAMEYRNISRAAGSPPPDAAPLADTSATEPPLKGGDG